MEVMILILALVLIFILIFIALSMHVIIIGANISKTDEERKIEDEEQIKFLNNLEKY